MHNAVHGAVYGAMHGAVHDAMHGAMHGPLRGNRTHSSILLISLHIDILTAKSAKMIVSSHKGVVD